MFSAGSPTRWSALRRRRRPSRIFRPPRHSSGIPKGGRLAAVARVNRVEMSLLKGIDRVRDLLVENTERFARGLPANNALLWGARGMGKVVAGQGRACRGRSRASRGGTAAHRNSPRGHRVAAGTDGRCFATRGSVSSCSATTSPSTPRTRRTSRSRPCSKAASKDARTTSSSTLRRTAAICWRAKWSRTNARPRSIPARRSRKKSRCRIGSDCGSAFTAAARTNISPWSKAMSRHYRIPFAGEELRREALEWATTRGARSGRVAWQYVQDLAGRLGVALDG